MIFILLVYNYVQKCFIANLFAKVSILGVQKCHPWYVRPYIVCICSPFQTKHTLKNHTCCDVQSYSTYSKTLIRGGLQQQQ